MKLQTLPGLASKNQILRAEDSPLKAPFKTLGQKINEILLLSKRGRDWMPHSRKIWTDVENLRERNIEPSGVLRESTARATVEIARLKGVREVLDSAKL